MTTRRYDLTLSRDGQWVAETTTEVDLDDRPAVYRVMAAMIGQADGWVHPERIRRDYALTIYRAGSPYPKCTWVPTEADQDA